MEQQPSSRKGAVVLMLSSRSLKARAGLGVGPHACDDARPVAARALGVEEPGQLQVRAEDGRHGLADGRVGHARGQRAGLDVGGELLPVELQEVDGAEEARREDGAHAEHGVALAKPAGHLCVHALERIGGVLLPEHCGVDEPQLNRSESVALPRPPLEHHELCPPHVDLLLRPSSAQINPQNEFVVSPSASLVPFPFNSGATWSFSSSARRRARTGAPRGPS